MKRLPLPLLYVLMMLPWVWIALGMWVFENFATTAFLYMLFGCLIPYLVFAKPKPEFVGARFDARWALAGILFGVGCMFVGWYLFEEALFQHHRFVETLQNIHFKASHHFIYFALFFVLINPVIEELFWRGLIYNQCKEHFPLKSAILISSFFFGAYHWLLLQTTFSPLGALITTATVIIGGIIFAFEYRKTGGLLAPILVHGLGYDLPIIILAYLQIQKAETSGALSILF